ncbi:MAG: LLM class F420-dependent oxidoreductase [Deltaproteobacteria bacterium]|jgi:probable F420-dependent oxidoreductase|nr:LLM class F420-dependent oxidoreductase [Deltaproteobacteria bacterium]
MEVGLFFTAGEGAVDIARVARAAETAGFGSLWVGEHVLMPVEYEHVYPGSADGVPPSFARLLSSPLIALARAAAVTESLRIGTGVCLLPLREPIALAKDIATLDNDSGGRFLFGVGGGWMREETEILGGDFDRRWRQIADSVSAMKALWRDDVSRHEGPYTRFPPVEMRPKPCQSPYPPVLLGGASPHIFDRIAAWGDGWIPGVSSVAEVREGREQLFASVRRVGRDPEDFTLVAFGLPDALRTRSEAEALQELGVHHMTVWLQARGEAVFAEIDALAHCMLA